MVSEEESEDALPHPHPNMYWGGNDERVRIIIFFVRRYGADFGE